MLPHTDPEASLVFYRDLLGFEVRMDVGQGTMRWITIGPADQPDVAIVLYPPAADPGLSEEEKRVIAEMMAKGTFATIHLSTKNLDETFGKLQAGEVDIVQEPTDQQWGGRDAALRDPSGNLVRLHQAG